jgi:hypothetical protein
VNPRARPGTLDRAEVAEVFAGIGQSLDQVSTPSLYLVTIVITKGGAHLDQGQLDAAFRQLDADGRCAPASAIAIAMMMISAEGPTGAGCSGDIDYAEFAGWWAAQVPRSVPHHDCNPYGELRVAGGAEGRRTGERPRGLGGVPLAALGDADGQGPRAPAARDCRGRGGGGGPGRRTGGADRARGGGIGAGRGA